jgi:curved DNA-binding protein
MSACDYKCLGISKDATLDEARRAYKSMARKFHPDKLKENGLDQDLCYKFIQISESYQRILQNDDDTVSICSLNSHTTIDLDESIRNSQLGDFYTILGYYLNIIKYLIQFFAEYRNNNESKVKNSNIDIIIPVTVKLEEIYNEIYKKLVIRVQHQNMKTKSQTIYICLENYLNHIKSKSNCIEYIFKEHGDYYKDGSRSDVHVCINIDMSLDNRYKWDLDGYNIICHINISLEEYLNKCIREIKYFNNVIINETWEYLYRDIQHLDNIMIYSTKMGIPYNKADDNIKSYGNLTFKFHILITDIEAKQVQFHV